MRIFFTELFTGNFERIRRIVYVLFTIAGEVNIAIND
jgi:hypothetical protein